ncbi:MAG: hypothetical protein WC333_04485 [Dehalococcoidia bacterium]
MAESKKWETAIHDPGDMSREMREGHGGKLVNMLVGLIINSNDAYERAGIEKPRKIRIEIDKTKEKIVKGRKGKARVRVVDWAEGMDYDDFGRNFQSYGGPKSQWKAGKKISGLFGREASDIMWSNVSARYLCIKAGQGYVCEFRPIVDFKRYVLTKREIKPWIKEYAANQTLTVAEFYLDEDYPITPFDPLVSMLRKHFRLRLINKNNNIKITMVYIQQSGKKRNEANIKFEPLELEGEGAELVDEYAFKMRYKAYPEFNGEAMLYKKKDREITQSGIDREGGLLIYADDETVMDLTLFGFDESAYAAYNRRFFGYIRLNVADIIRKELRDASQKLAVIEVDRSGLRKRNSEFYGNLKQIMDDWLRPNIEKEQTAISSTSARSLTSDWNRKLRPLWAEINKIISDKTGRAGKVVGPKGPPPDTLAFARSKISPSEGAIYRIELLFNTRTITPGSPYKVTCDNSQVHVVPNSGIVPKANHPNLTMVGRQIITICADAADEEACIEAIVPGYEPAVLHVSSVEPDIHVPVDGIEWWPDEFEAAEGEISHPTLWVDITKTQISSGIKISSSDEFIEIQDSFIEVSQLYIVKDDPIRNIKVGKIRPRMKAHGINQQGTLIAEMDMFSDILQLSVVEKEPRRPPGWWTFSGIQWEKGYSPDIDLYPNGRGEVCFNITHSLIASYFGSNAADAPILVKKDVGLQRLAAHMVVDFILNDISRNAWRNVDSANPNFEIETRDNNRMAEQVYNYVMKLKGTHGVDWVEKIAEALSG